MENDEQKLQIPVAYRFDVVTQIPHLLTVSKQSVSLVPTSSQPKASPPVFDVPPSQIQKVILTPWAVNIRVNQHTYSLALYLRNGPLVKAPDGQPEEFTLSRGLQKNRALQKTFRGLGIPYSDYTIPLSVGFVIFILVIFSVVATTFL